MGYTNEQLLASAREHAFQGIVTISVLRERDQLRDELKKHFEAILDAIDTAGW